MLPDYVSEIQINDKSLHYIKNAMNSRMTLLKLISWGYYQIQISQFEPRSRRLRASVYKKETR